MTLIDPPPTSELPRPPRRSWRDLPASPPLGDLLPPPDPAGLIPPASPTAESAPTQDAPPPPRSRRRTAWIVAGGVTVAAVALGAVLLLDGDDDATTTPTVAADELGSPAAVAAALGPAVVQIEIAGGMGGGGVGSGVVYDPAGLVLTAHHVVATADEVVVRTADDTELSGRVVGRLPERDLAIVAVDTPDELVAAQIAEPGTVEVGEDAIALGSPFGFQASVTAGIVSGLERELETPAGTLTGLIQTDAPINPGNSGGALANRFGEVIGINTMIYSQNGENNGIGFAVPIATAKGVADKLVAGESVERAFLGVSSQAPQDGSAGAQIVSVESGSPAADAGLRRGDVIVALDGTEMQGSAALAAAIGARQPGDVVTLEVVRADESLEIEVELGTKG
ncbi:MAG: trypsin-like peptidase domain-containing protein [Acidimicrobiales bacterium]|nr:trypsin-like peptidase domain-containing protein [Acidimicrobiales bacterium]